MQQVSIVADTIASLTREQIEQHRISIIPAKFTVKGREYRDSLDISASEAYRLLNEDPDSFSTSAASPSEFLDALRQASGIAGHIVCVTVSSRLSAQHDVAQVAAGLLQQELPDSRVEVLDSKTASGAEGLIALAAARAAEEGKSLTEVVETARDVISRVRLLLVLETLRHVHRTGRVPKIAAQAGSALSIKPILTSRDGLIRIAGVTRTKQQGLNRIVQTMKNEVGSKPVHVAVIHAEAAEQAQSLEQRIASEFNCADLWISEFSPLMGYATGPGVLGLGFYAAG